MFIAVYVNDLFQFDADIDSRIDDIMQNLRDEFQITNLCNVLYYLRIELNDNLNKKNYQSLTVNIIEENS